MEWSHIGGPCLCLDLNEGLACLDAESVLKFFFVNVCWRQ